MRALAVLLALTAACSKAEKKPGKPPPAPVQVLTIAPTEIRDTGEYLGTLLSRDSVVVLPQVAGYVRKIHVRPGQKVKAGATLVEVDAREETAALASAGAQAASARAQASLARQSLSRAEALYKEGLATAQEIDQRRADLAAAQAAVRAAGAQVSQRRVAASYFDVRAPVPGVLGDVTVRIGDYVTATTQLTSIAGANALELSVAIPSSRARKLTVGAPIEILGDDGKLLIESKVFFISPEADPRTQLVEVKATFDNTAGLRPRELVRARVVYDVEQAIQVPLLAVIRQSGQAFVLVVVDEGGKQVARRKPIKLGELGERGYAIESGLAAGDRIAITSLQTLKDGAEVAIAPPKPAAPGDDAGSAATAPPPAPAPASKPAAGSGGSPGTPAPAAASGS